MNSYSLPYTPFAAQLYAQHLATESGFIWFHEGKQDAATEWFTAYPCKQFEYWGKQKCVVTEANGNVSEHLGSFIALLQQAMPLKAPNVEPSAPFVEGLAGHLNYDLGLEIVNVNSQFDVSRAPLATVGHYQWSCVIDHAEQTANVYISPNINTETKEAVERFIEQATRLEKSGSPAKVKAPWQCTMDEAHYKAAFNRIKTYIVEGDIYQANLTRQWQTVSDIPAWSLYLELCSAMPAPFSVYHHTQHQTLLSVSPERFIQINGERIFTQPIKGTRPRSSHPTTDIALQTELLSSDKDKAENLMIVDLLRNDIAKNAKPGSVMVEKLFELQSFKNVHHLVSSVSAIKNTHAHPLSVLWDAFPGGSITGAPKRRAMEVIDELETVPRGAYCGSAFYLRDDGYLDSNILIRTVTKKGSTLRCSGGGGIVFDSEVESEYAESELKVRRLLDALT